MTRFTDDNILRMYFGFSSRGLVFISESDMVKKTMIFLGMFFLVAVGMEAQVLCKHQDDIVAIEQNAAERKLNFRADPRLAHYDILHQELAIEVDPGVRYISGSVTTTFRVMHAQFDEMYFNLSDALEVHEILSGNRQLAFTHAEDLIRIQFPAVLDSGAVEKISVFYEGVPPVSGFGSFKTELHNGVPVLWTLSEPYGARDWWPCKQDLSDKIDSIDILVTTPVAYKVASNGILEGVLSHELEKHTYHWKHRYPIPAYLVAIGVTNYAAYTDTVHLANGEMIEILNYVYPENLAFIKTQTQASVGIMGLFNTLFGTYPFASEKYGHAQFGFPGGMEHQTMSFMGGFSHLLQAHEMAHQWFGDKVTCGSWTDIWLNEGFATYAEGLTYAFGVGPSSWEAWVDQKISHVTSQPGGSVYCDDTTSVSRIFSSRLSYSKGAMLLHMLRWILGDDAFFEAIRNYHTDPEIAFGFARTGDLKRHLEAQSGLDLEEFFNDWFYGEGYPGYHISWWRDGDKLNLRINQTTSHPSVDFFEMPLPIQVKGIDQDTLLRIDHISQDQVFEVAIPFEIEEIIFDPDRWIISRDNMIDFVSSAEQIPSFTNVTLAPNPFDKVLLLNDPEGQVEEVAIFDGQGRPIQYERSGNRLHLRSPGSGLYLVKVRAGGTSKTFKVVKN